MASLVIMLSMFLVVLAALVAVVYYLSIRRFDYWSKRNVPYMKPSLFFGNYQDAILVKKHITYVLEDLCKNFQNEPYFGVFFGTEPTLVVKDPEIIKLITTKDFYYFYGREISKYAHKEVLNLNIFSSSGDYWKVIRQNLTPVFTSAKMKNMFPLIVNCAYEFEDVLNTEVISPGVFKIRPVVTNFTISSIASCAFGIDFKTLGKEYENNPFLKIANFSEPNYKLVIFSYYIRIIWPAIFYILGFKFIPDSLYITFKKLIVKTFESRKYKPTSRKDLIDFVLDFKQNSHLSGGSITNVKTGKNDKVHLPVTDDLLIAQSFAFYVAGFETSSSATSLTLYLLAKHPEAQKKVQAEVDACLQKYGNKLTYDIVNDLPYTWVCVEEALRMYPLSPYISREVMEDYTLPNGLTLEKGVRIHIAVNELHHNPKYFPDPEVFRPERFLGEERRNIIPFSYLPFGEGPRICIGMRFAKMQVLAAIVTVMKKYTLDMTEQTPKNIEFSPFMAVPGPESSLVLKAVPRPGWESRLFNKG